MSQNLNIEYNDVMSIYQIYALSLLLFYKGYRQRNIVETRVVCILHFIPWILQINFSVFCINTSLGNYFLLILSIFCFVLSNHILIGSFTFHRSLDHIMHGVLTSANHQYLNT